jgi:hypothetical protein
MGNSFLVWFFDLIINTIHKLYEINLINFRISYPACIMH